MRRGVRKISPFLLPHSTRGRKAKDLCQLWKLLQQRGGQTFISVLTRASSVYVGVGTRERLAPKNGRDGVRKRDRKREPSKTERVIPKTNPSWWVRKQPWDSRNHTAASHRGQGVPSKEVHRPWQVRSEGGNLNYTHSLFLLNHLLKE